MEFIIQYFDVFALGIGLLLLIFFASSLKRREKRLFMLIILLIFVLSVFEYLETQYDQLHVETENFPRYLFSFICYCLRPAILASVFYLTLSGKNKKEHFIWIPVGINAVIYQMCFYTKWVFWYTEENQFKESFLGYTVYVICFLYLVSFTILAILESKVAKTKSIILIAMIIFAIISVVISSVSQIEFNIVIDAFMICLTFYYMFISYQNVYRTAMEHSKQMNEKNTALMLSQIQPHFIYNTLATVQVLCDIDPELAANTISDFSQYLRTNMDALDKTQPVLLMDEVKHAQCYAKIEQLRFDTIKVIFDIKDENFHLPVLTIQPMVENAIKYGIRGLENGTVWVRTYLKDNLHYLEIEDNGRGFDIEAMGKDGRNHIGVINVKSRIENMVHGAFTIESEIGKGTKVTIVIEGE